MEYNIRNFSIIAHIDHGKSTLADRMLEITKTVETRKMREQYLDQMPLERERGITIKMQPVRMNYQLKTINYVLNLIDTPGHVDFSYEVSRALAAVEGAVLLVDATQGVEAQTLSNVELARALNLVILPVINKIDLAQARIKETSEEVKNLLGCPDEDILKVSARTGEGVSKLLEEIIKRVPPPRPTSERVETGRALIFDFDYSLHRGVIAHVRVFDGEIKKGDRLKLFQARENFVVGEVGFFKPEFEPAQDADPVTGHQPGWLPVGNGPDDKWFREAWDRTGDPDRPQGIACELPDGTYELCGPKIQGNPEGLRAHCLIPHGIEQLEMAPRDFNGIRAFLSDGRIEGIVWHHPNGDMVKIKGCDFGIKRAKL